jgi:HEAT repeat protein
LLAIRATIREAVAVIKTDPDVAVRVGSRAIPALVDKLSDPDRAVRGAAANALTQLGDPEGMKLMSEALADDAGRTA